MSFVDFISGRNDESTIFFDDSNLWFEDFREIEHDLETCQRSWSTWILTLWASQGPKDWKWSIKKYRTFVITSIYENRRRKWTSLLIIRNLCENYCHILSEPYVDKQSCFETPKFLNWPLYCRITEKRLSRSRLSHKKCLIWLFTAFQSHSNFQWCWQVCSLKKKWTSNKWVLLLKAKEKNLW